mgnify:CR=1 FL=1
MLIKKDHGHVSVTHVAQYKVDKLLDAFFTQVCAQALPCDELVLLECHQPILSKHVVVRADHCVCVCVCVCVCGVWL